MKRIVRKKNNVWKKKLFKILYKNIIFLYKKIIIYSTLNDINFKKFMIYWELSQQTKHNYLVYWIVIINIKINKRV